MAEMYEIGKNLFQGPKDQRAAHEKIKNAEDFTELKTRFRSLEVRIYNQTSVKMTYSGAYFFTGQWYYHLKTETIEPGQVWIECAANKDGKAFSGVTGGCSFMVGKTKIGFGFTNPWMGSFKISVVKGNAEQAYDSCEDKEPKQLYCDQYYVKCYLDDSQKGAQKAFVFIVSETNK